MTKTYKYEIRQEGKMMLAADDEFTIPIIWNNLTRKNKMTKAEYRAYIQYVVMNTGGFHCGPIELWKEGRLIRKGEITLT